MEVGICKQCGRKTFIQSKIKGLCSDCVYKNNHGGKTRQQVAIEKQKEKPIKFEVKRIKHKVTGERQMFLKIWENRPHYCVNCGSWLGNEPKSFMFSHKIAKSINEKERLNPDNIELLCMDCHFARDMQGQEVFEKRTKGLINKI